jgi:alanine racemase
MGRIGFAPTEESLDIIDKIFDLPGIQVTGVFTHFATADEENKEFTMEQYKKFRFITDGIEQRGHKGLIRHCANSGAILDCPELQLDMVRSGIITYGMFPSDEVSKDIDLIPAMEWKSQVSYVKTVEAGTSIGYGRTYFTDKTTKVATIPVGYADGYSRSLSNRGRVLINGEFAKVIGNICMDQMMVDVTDIPGVSAGSEVVLMGKQGKNQITAEELAKTENTINYEVVCNVGKRVPRVFIRNDEIIGTKAILNV